MSKIYVCIDQASVEYSRMSAQRGGGISDNVVAIIIIILIKSVNNTEKFTNKNNLYLLTDNKSYVEA